MNKIVASIFALGLIVSPAIAGSKGGVDGWGFQPGAFLYIVGDNPSIVLPMPSIEVCERELKKIKATDSWTLANAICVDANPVSR